MSKDAYYFPHDSNAKDDPKCVLLIEQLGMEGYGIYWMLIETLRDQPEYSYPVALLAALARRYNTTPEKVKTVVYNYGLFTVKDDTIFFSQSLNNRMATFERKREQNRVAGRISAERRALMKATGNDCSTSVQHSINDCSTSKVKKSKVKEIKEGDARGKRKSFSPPTLPEFEKYFTDNGYSSELAKRAYNGYAVADWKDATGKPVKNWKQKACHVWFKPENTIPKSADHANPVFNI